MKRLVAIFGTLLLVSSALAYSGAQIAQQALKIEVEEKNPWTNLGLRNRSENFQFAIVTDRTGGHRPGVFAAATRKLNLLQPEFVMSVGDLIEGYTEDQTKLSDEWTEFNDFVKSLEMPFFYVPGNHDLSNQVMLPVWQNQFGRTYFSFVYHDVLFIGLNSEDPPGKAPANLGEEQLAWLESVLKANPDVKWTLMFIHKPMWQYGEKANWGAVEKLLGDRPRTVFGGHHHRYAAAQVGDHTYYALATTGGGSKLRGPEQGEFDHFVWVTMTPEGPRLANLMLDGIWTADPVAEANAKAAEAKAKAEAEAAAKPAEPAAK